MIMIPSYSEPPEWMQAAVSAFLPPACREPVLGDLQERFGERSARARWLGYVGDAATTVPQVLRSQMRRIVTRESVCATAIPGDLRSRAEHFQTQVWIRNFVILLSVVILIAVFLLNVRGAWRFHDSVSLAMTAGWIVAAWRSYGLRGRSTAVPSSLSWDELRTFHRCELERQMSLGCREFVYWSLPAVSLILYALAIAAPGFRGGLMLLAALALQNCAVAWGREIERSRYRRELDRLEQEVEPA